MNPIKFEGFNCIYGDSQDEYLNLPAYRHDDEWGSVSACWKLKFWERLKILFTGRIYTTWLSFGNPLTPLRLDVNSPIMAKAIESPETEVEDETHMCSDNDAD
jgi:hypothetical protein